MNSLEAIPKEEIPNYHFVTYDVLDNNEDRNNRVISLQQAMVLGNNEHHKLRIYFTTTDGMKVVETTVWAATEDAVTLKGGVVIPVNCVNKISFY
jgi:hypothetical protein